MATTRVCPCIHFRFTTPLTVTSSVEPCADGTSPYEVAEKMGIYKQLDSGSPMTTTLIIERIAENRRLYEQRNARKVKKAEAEKEMEKGVNRGE